MTEKTVDKKTNHIKLDQVEKDNWSSILATIRQHDQKATIESWRISQETATVNYTIKGFENRTFTQEVDATLHPSNPSEFESLLEYHGYTPYEKDALVGDTINIDIERTEKGLAFRIPTRENQDENGSSKILPTIIASFITGVIPIFNIIAVLAIIKNTTESTESFTGDEVITAIGITAGCVITYIIGYLIYLT